MIIHVTKKVIKSFFKFVLLTALIHIGILAYRAIREGNIKVLNYFNILNLNSFFPRISVGWVSDLISIILMLAIFTTFLVFSLLKKEIKTEN